MKLKLFILLFACITGSSQFVQAQFLIEMIDTSNVEGKGLWLSARKQDHLSVVGYFQPQFQWAQEKGTDTYNGGNFAQRVDNRFMIRRGRIRFDYAHFTAEGKPSLQFALQFDGSERGVNIRDFWGRLYENRWELFTVTTGMFARPFGYEINLSSQVRETPERGRMSQILMKTERDLGAMVSFEPRRKGHRLAFLKWDIGVFNGQGMTGPNEFDSYKDLITRLSVKPLTVSSNFTVSGGLSYLHGALAHNSRYVYNFSDGRHKQFSVDSSVDNLGSRSPRKYYGADLQTTFKHGWGKTIVRGEYWRGTQTGTALSSETPGELEENAPFYIRDFDGAFVYLLQNIINEKHQAGLKFDFYDPNRKLKGSEIKTSSNGHSNADIKYTTITVGYNHYFNQNLKLFLWYDIVRNESTQLTGYETDVRDNVFTCRLQYSF